MLRYRFGTSTLIAQTDEQLELIGLVIPIPAEMLVFDQI
jgi:hypothetical protein